MSNFTPEQLNAVNFNKGDLIVSASAGSGKTQVMIARIIRLITSEDEEVKAHVNEILATTFTEKAAQEIKDRLYEELSKKIAESDNEKVRQELSNELELISIADVSTLHAFCAKTLRNYFFEANLPADFTIADEKVADKYKETAINELFDELYEKKQEDFLDLVNIFASGRSDKNLKEYVKKTYEKTISKLDFDKALSASLDYYNKDGFNQLITEASEYVKQKLSVYYEINNALLIEARMLENQKLIDFLKDFSIYLKDLLNADGIYGMLKNYDGIKKPTKSGDEITKDLHDRVKDLKDTVEKYISDLKKTFTLKDQDLERFLSVKGRTQTFIDLVNAFKDKYSSLKLADGKLDFNDLERYMLNLLKDEKIREDLCLQYKYVFIDEYQDVNDVQEAIINAVGRNNVFTVGDVKQGIYGFRGCNADNFNTRLKRLERTKQAIRLDQNFRSAINVVNGVNKVFNACMTESTADIDYKSNALKFGETYIEEAAGEFEVYYTEKEKKEQDKDKEYSVYSVKDEALKTLKEEDFKTGDKIADLIKSIIGKEYYNAKAQCFEKIGYKDIVILVRNSTNFYKKLVKQLLKRNIPVSAESKISVTQYPEIKVLIDVLKYIDGDVSDVPIISALKNLADFTEEDFIKIRRFYDVSPLDAKEKNFASALKYYAHNVADDLAARINDFKKYFDWIKLLAEFTGASAVLERVIKDWNYDIKVLAMKLGKLRKQRVERFIAEGRLNGTFISVGEMLDRIDASSKSIVTSYSSGADAVRVMTMHSSKGMQFPVTIVAGLETDFNFSDTKDTVMIEKDLGVALNYYDEDKNYASTVLRFIMKERMKSAIVKEEMRLLYVAMTRARYALYMFTEKCDKAIDYRYATKMADFLPDNLHMKNADKTEYDIGESLSGDVNLDDNAYPDDELTELIKKNLTYKYPNERGTKLPVKTSVTASLKADEDSKTVYMFTEAETETGAERGTAVHKFLENADFNAKDVKEELLRQLNSGLLLKEQADLIDTGVIQKVFDSNIMSSLNGYELYREQNFILNCPSNELFGDGDYENKVLLQGVIDLLAVKGDSAIIVDYKYSKKGRDELIKTYQKQLRLYKYAVETVLKLKVEKMLIISLIKGEVIEID